MLAIIDFSLSAILAVCCVHCIKSLFHKIRLTETFYY